MGEGELAKETQKLRDQQDTNLSEQIKVNNQVKIKQDAVGDDIELLGKKLEELAAQGEAGARAEEQQEKSASEIAQLQEQGTDLMAKTGGLEEQMGALVQTAAELMGRFEECAPKQAVTQLRARVDGGFDALLVRLEADRWMRESV